MSSAALTRARQLLRARFRKEQGRFLAEGPHVVEEALFAGVALEDVFISHEARERPELEALAQRAHAGGAFVHAISARQLSAIADTRTPQGIIAIAPLPRGSTVAEKVAAGGGWIVLDGVQDPGNVGTLLRAGDAFGLRGVVTAEGTADPWSGKVMRAGQGAQFRLDVHARGYRSGAVSDEDAVAFVSALRDSGGEIWAADLEGDDLYDTAPPTGAFGLLLGSESHGLSAALDALATRRVRVPQPGRADSLNVAMAGTVLLSWMTRSKHPQPELQPGLQPDSSRPA